MEAHHVYDSYVPARLYLFPQGSIRASIMHQAPLEYDVLPAVADTTAGRSIAGQVVPVVPGHTSSLHLDQRPGRQY